MTTNTKTKPTTAPDRTADALELLAEGIKKLTSGEEWAKYLRMQSAFHQYSFANTMLILAQCPDATRVAGFKTWLKLNRAVKKGEKAIWILAPRFYKPKASETEPTTTTDDNQDDENEGRVYFRPVPVFDLSQTEGEPLPSPIQRLQGDDGGLFERTKAWAEAWGCPVTVEDFEGRANGYYEPDRHAITVRAGMPLAQQLKTLVHELAHAHLHRDIEVYRAHRGDCELEAESTAFVVLNHYGIDAGAYSFGYVVGWAGGDESAIKSLKSSAQRIQQTAKAIIDGIAGKEARDALED